jgi:D-serine dehydratase
MERKKQELINNRRELINMITMNKRSIRESEENILVLENRLRNFVPFPKIILPKTEKLRNEIDMPIDAFSMIKMKDDKYIIDGGDYSEV